MQSQGLRTLLVVALLSRDIAALVGNVEPDTATSPVCSTTS